MNSEEQINSWLKNHKSKDKYNIISLTSCYSMLISKFRISLDYIDDSNGGLIIEWTYKDKKYYIDCSDGLYTYAIFNKDKKNISNGHSLSFEEVISDVDLLMTCE